jgi:hypothetical protein
MTLTAIPTYMAISHNLPPWLLKSCIKIFRCFLWSGSEAAHGAQCLVVWGKVQRPLALGGLGVVDLKFMGCALRLRWFWHQRTAPSKPWALMKVDEDAITNAFFRALVAIKVENDASTLFWTERWINGQGVEELVPDLLAMVPARRRSTRTVRSALCNNSWLHNIGGPLTLSVLTQYMCLRELVDTVHLTDHDDKVS